MWPCLEGGLPREGGKASGEPTLNSTGVQRVMLPGADTRSLPLGLDSDRPAPNLYEGTVGQRPTVR
jgi:hypothetical protein